MTTSTDTPTTAAPQLPSATKPPPLQIVGWLLTYRDGASEFLAGATRPSLYGPDCEEIAAVVLACDAEAYAQATAARQRALCDDAWDAVETLQRVSACQAAHHRKQRQALEAELSQHQRSEFHPDWSLLQATQESLREKMAEIQRLRQELAGIRDIAHAAKQAVQLRLHIYMMTDSICARGRPRDVSIACRNTQEDAERAFCEAVTTWAAQLNDTATQGQRAAQHHLGGANKKGAAHG